MDRIKSGKSASKSQTRKSRLPKDSLFFYIKGSPLLVEPYHFKGAGLPNIYLRNGVHVEESQDYGRLVTIENLNGLFAAIGVKILEKRKRFTGAEFRFLRKQMKLTQSELGRRLNISDQTIANWEKDKTAPPIASVGMRIVYLLHVLPPDTPTHVVNDLLALASDVGIRLPDVDTHKIAKGWREAA
jgi:DNA-binding transcriptional regulator YiaG